MAFIPIQQLQLKAQLPRVLRSISKKHSYGLYQQPTRLKHRPNAILAACLQTQTYPFSRSLVSSSSHKQPRSIGIEWYDLSPARQIQWMLEPGDNKWGWVIYRCTYKTELQGPWEKFKNLVEYRIRKAIANSDAPDIAEKLDLAWIEDSQLEGAPLSELKHRFREWARTETQHNFDPSAHSSEFGTRYSNFIQVDEESLVSCLRECGVDLHGGHVNIVRGWADGLAPEEATDEFGDALDAEDWMKIPASEIIPSTYMEFDNDEMWRMSRV
ncbi:hypothetical protein MKX08_009066 [Trichoderma sp. CBMAI-0020]|nr:hypothetical protein MKX08_009066 [Trichoderma sp. CBMAI-0020]